MPYLNGSSSSSFQLGLGPSAVVVRQTVRWKDTSTKGRTKTYKQVSKQRKQTSVEIHNRTLNYIFNVFRKIYFLVIRLVQPRYNFIHLNIAFHGLLSIYEAFKNILYATISKSLCVFRILDVFICTDKTTFSPENGKATGYLIKESNWNRTCDPATSGKKCTCILLSVIQEAYSYNPGCPWNWLLWQISNFI